MLKSVTVLQSSRMWKTVIHHCLAPLDTRLWPWVTNSITDVLRQLRLNNYTEEERTFSTRLLYLMDGYKYGWSGMMWTLQKGLTCRAKGAVSVGGDWAGTPTRWLPCRAVSLKHPHLCLMNMYTAANVICKTHWEWWQCDSVTIPRCEGWFYYVYIMFGQRCFTQVQVNRLIKAVFFLF